MDIMSAFRTSIEQIANWSNNKLSSKVDKVDGKALSTNDYTQTDKEKVNNMATSLSISDGNLFLSNDSGIIENSGVILPSGAGGTGIQSIEQTTISTQDEGVNVITATLTDGTSSTFEVRNGSKGTTPTKGTDYWTSEDIAQIESYCKNYIDTELLGGAS